MSSVNAPTWFTFLIILAISRTFAAPECRVTQWTNWGRCKRDPPCGSHERTEHRPNRTASFAEKAKEPSASMVGKEMHDSTRIKTALYLKTARCRTDRSCPELDPHGTDGPKACVDGLSGIYPCRNVDRISMISIHDLGYQRNETLSWNQFGFIKIANDLWGWTDQKTKDEYVIIGTSGGTSFVRITDPYKPVVLGFLYRSPGTKTSLWRDIKVVNDHAFITSEALGSGLQIFDLRRLRRMKKFQLLSPSWWYRGFGKAHNVVANEETGYVYVVGDNESKYRWPASCKGGLHIINVKYPTRPRFEGCYDEDGYTHDAQCLVYRGPDKRYTGHEICFAYNLDSLTIVDVTNHSRPVMISKRGYRGSRYTHQGWLTDDQKILLMDDELDEYYAWDKPGQRTRTFIWDVSDLRNPQLKNTHYSINHDIDHNLYIHGAFTYQSNYAAGLRILHIDEKHYRLREVGYYDVFPGPLKRPTFRGSWSNYPFFASGVVPVSSIDDGLFLLRPDYKKLDKVSQQEGPQGAQFRTRKIISATNGAACPAVEQRRDCEPTEICATP